jgi:hypothetical protein
MKTNILKSFSEKFANATTMWNKLSADFNSVKERDKEMFDAMNILGETIDQFVEANAIMAKPDGVSIKEALDVINKKKNKKTNEDYTFLVFVLLKNLEDSGLIKVFSRPERIVKDAMKAHAKKRTEKSK